MSKILENMEVKVMMQRKKINQILEQNKYLIEDLNKLKALEEAELREVKGGKNGK